MPSLTWIEAEAPPNSPLYSEPMTGTSTNAILEAKVLRAESLNIKSTYRSLGPLRIGVVFVSVVSSVSWCFA